LPLCSSYLPLGVPNWAASTANTKMTPSRRQRRPQALPSSCNSIWISPSPSFRPTIHQGTLEPASEHTTYERPAFARGVGGDHLELHPGSSAHCRPFFHILVLNTIAMVVYRTSGRPPLRPSRKGAVAGRAWRAATSIPPRNRTQ
jgi:hypothetical protein